MNKSNVITLADYKNSKSTLEQNSKYENLLETLSISEICTEINDLIGEFKSMIGLGKNEAEQGKMILRQLEERCTEQQCSEQINHLLSQIEKQMSTIER